MPDAINCNKCDGGAKNHRCLKCLQGLVGEQQKDNPSALIGLLAASLSRLSERFDGLARVVKEDTAETQLDMSMAKDILGITYTVLARELREEADLLARR